MEFDGDTATGIQHYVFIEQGTHEMRLAWYNDEYRRTVDGWRIHRRSTTFMRRSGGFDSGNRARSGALRRGPRDRVGAVMRIGIMIGPETRNYAGKVDRLCEDAARGRPRRVSQPRGSRNSRRTSTP